MANRVKNYSYIKRSDISVLKATIDGKVLDVDPKTILSGTYVAGKIKPTAAKLRVAKVDPSKIREKMLKMYKDWAEDEYNSEFEKYIRTEDIQKFVECGLTEEMIIAFYCGIQAVMDIKADNEFAYNPIGGVFSFRTDMDGQYVKNWVKRGLYNCQNGVYELGFKYPEFNWSFLKRTDNTEVISTEPYDYFGKKRVDRIKVEKYKVNDKFTFIACKSAGYSEDGVFSKYSDDLLNAGAPLELNGGYLALVSRNSKELFALAKKLLSQTKGYVKAFDWLVQSKTSGATELKEANYKFAKGGIVYLYYGGEREDQTVEVANKEEADNLAMNNGAEHWEYVEHYAKGGFTYSKGGRIDLFEDYDNQPSDVAEILSQYELEDSDYKTLHELQKRLETETGYTFDYGLDAEPYGLRPVGVELNELEGYEEYAKGGNIQSLEKSLDSAEKSYRKAVQSERVGIISTAQLQKAKTRLDNARKNLNDWYASKPIQKANVGALLMAEKAKGIAPKSFDAADTKIANRLSRKTFAQRMSETGNEQYDQNQYEANKFAKGGGVDEFDAIKNAPITYTLYQGEKVFLTTKSFNKAVDTRTIEKFKGNFLTLEMKDSKNNVRTVKFSNGGGIEDDYMSFARTNARESINWDEEVRNYAGDQYDSLTEEEKDSIIAEMKANYDFHHSFEKGGKLSETKYIPRDEIIKVELKNGKVIENNWNNPIYSGLRLGKGITEREEMEAQGQLTMFKRGGKMPKYAAYVSQRNIAKVYLYDEDEPTVVNGRDLVGGVWFDNEKTVKLIESARKQGLIK